MVLGLGGLRVGKLQEGSVVLLYLLGGLQGAEFRDLLLEWRSWGLGSGALVRNFAC